MKIAKTISILTFLICLVSCANKDNKTLLEVTKFQLKSNADILVFNTLDTQVESDFTTKQSGFINRQSAIDENGVYTVLVYWETTEDAKASMAKFMTDKSVAAYASMIDESTMHMSRYAIDSDFKAKGSEFVEVMSFNTTEDTDMDSFNKINKKVETDFTAKKKGFLQRVKGVSENGEQVVVVYWDNKTNSDKALAPFMKNDIAKEFMGMMDQSSIQMVRSQILK